MAQQNIFKITVEYKCKQHNAKTTTKYQLKSL